MPTTRVHLPRTPTVEATWAQLRDELHVDEAFPSDAVAEATTAAAAPTMPDADLTDVAFFTLDPPGSLDLDQAVHLERRTGNAGFRVRYAIADVAAFVHPGGGLDREAHRRGETLYFPDLRVPLHPPVLNEGAASLLPDAIRPALVWTIDLDADGEPTSVDVRRARVRSTAKLDYPTVQGHLDGGTADEPLVLLRDVGRLRLARAGERGAVDLPTPEQVVEDVDDHPRLSFRAPLPAEAWNAQISLLTGMAAARLMLDGGVGLLRTLPPADPQALASLRRSATALGVAWPDGERYGAFISRLDPANAAHAALLTVAARVLRGAAYTAFDGAPPAQPVHSAVAAPYAHCTAPLRRLADRYVGEVCVALCADKSVPGWARAALTALPEEMAAADRRAHELDRAVVDLAEAIVLTPSVGRTFDAVVVDDDERAGVVQLRDPAVRARCRHRDGAPLPLGQAVTVRLAEVDPVRRTVVFEPA